MKPEDLYILTFDEFKDWYTSQPMQVKVLIQAIGLTLEQAGCPQPVGCNLIYNLMRQHEIAMLGRIGDDSTKH